MIRTLLVIAAFVAAPAAAVAQVAPVSTTAPSGVTVHSPPRNAYVIQLDVTGKGAGEIRRMIWRASNEACNRVVRTAGMVRVYQPICAHDANEDGLQQLATVLERRRQGLPPVQVAIAPNIVTR